MLIDTISELQSLKQQVDNLEMNFKDIDKKIEIHNKTQTEITENQLETAKSIIEFLESMNLKDKYLDIVLELGCNDKKDLLFFKEEELVKNGFLLLHARKILSTLNSENDA